MKNPFTDWSRRELYFVTKDVNDGPPIHETHRRFANPLRATLARFATIDWLASYLLWGGNSLLIYQRHWLAWVIFIAANLLWVRHWWRRREWAALILVGSFIIQDVLGLVAWWPR